MHHAKKEIICDELTGQMGATPIMFPEGKSQNLMKMGSNDAYGSQTLKFQRAAKSAHIGWSSGHFSKLASFHFGALCTLRSFYVKIRPHQN